MNIGQTVARDRVHHRQVGDGRFGQGNRQTIGQHLTDLNLRAEGIRRIVGFAGAFQRLCQIQPRHREGYRVPCGVIPLENPDRRKTIQRRAIGDVYAIRIGLIWMDRLGQLDGKGGCCVGSRLQGRLPH